MKITIPTVAVDYEAAETRVKLLTEEDEVLVGEEADEYLEKGISAKHRLSPEEVNELMKDWFVRDGETFTKISEHNRLGWEATLAEESYSSFLTKGSDINFVIRRAYELASNFLLAMNVPGRVVIKLRDDHVSMTDWKAVHVSTKVFDDKDYDLGERIDVFIGCVVHEGGHLLYTNKKDYRDGCFNKGVSAILNVIEDERMEMEIGKELPGYTRFLEKVKYYFFDKFYLDEYREPDAKDYFTRIFNTFLRIIRFPRYLDREDIEFFGDYLVRIKDVLTPYPETTKEAAQAAKLVFEIIKEFYKDKSKEDMESSGDGEGIPDEVIEKLLDEAFRKDSEAGGDKYTKVFGSKTEDDKAKVEEAKGMDKYLPDVLEGKYERGKGNAFVLKEKSMRGEYNKSYEKVARYVAAIRKAIKYQDKDYKIVHKSMRSGYLDTSKLVEARQGVPTVYERHGEVKADKMAICLLIDLSGSMRGSSITAARETAILLNEALKDNNSIELFIYGHTADVMETYASQIHVYSEPGFRPRHSLGSVRAMSENRDGDAIREAAYRVRKFTQRQTLMFVISDGAPAASGYHGEKGIQDTRSATRKVKTMGFDVVQIAINSSYDPKRMFDHHVVLDDIGNLAKDLNKFVRKQLQMKQHIRTT